MGPLVNDKVDRTDDGTPIQPYQIGEEPSGRARGILGNGALGVAIAGLVALIRNLVATDDTPPSGAAGQRAASDGETARSHDASATASSKVVPMVAQTDVAASDASLNAVTLDEQQVLQLLRKPLDQTSLTFDFVASELRHPLPAGVIPTHGNDNESLYGFVPGVGIAFDPSSGLAAAGHGGGGGGADDGGDGAHTALRGGNTRQTDDEGEDDPVEVGNRRPTVANSGVRLRDQFAGHAVVIGLSSLLRGASDADGDELEVANLQASEGTLRPIGGDRWIYTPAEDAGGNVIFTYQITDGSLGTPQFAVLNIAEPATTQDVGTDGADVLTGTAAADIIDARAADDTIEARAGDDIIYGGDGDDVIHGGEGNDVIFAGAGNDIVFGGDGDDVVFAGEGDDTLQGDDGDDTLLGEDGDDTFVATVDDGNDDYIGGDGTDTYTAAATSSSLAVDLAVGTASSDETGADTLSGIENIIGSQGDDTISGDDAANALSGSAGNDMISGAAGDDILSGETGDDTFVATVNDGDDTMVGGEGSDTLDLSATQAAAVVDLTAGTSESAETGSDTVADIENVIGSQGDDTITGDAAANVIEGAAGNDTMSGGEGDDTFVATVNDGDDVIDGGEGSDTLDLSATQAAATVDLAAGTSESAETGSDTVADIENVIGSQGDDTITGGAAANVIEGAAGNDTMSGGEGDDTFVATVNDGDDVIDGGEGSDTYDASQIETGVVIDLQNGIATGQDIGTDTLDDIENAAGGAGDDILLASDDVNVLTGGDGNDLFVFEASWSSSGKGRGYRDQISDFEIGDRIDIKQLSYEAGETLEDLGFKRFVLINQGAEFTDPGQMRFRYEMFDEKAYTIIEGNIDDDPEHDFEIELRGYYALDEKDFYKLATSSSGTSHDES